MFPDADYDPVMGLFVAIPLAIAGYIYVAFCLKRISDNVGNTDISWLAWLPIGNTYVLVKAAGLSGWWIFIFMLGGIPILGILINFAFLMFLGIRITVQIKTSVIWGILLGIPGINLIAMGVLAFTKSNPYEL